MRTAKQTAAYIDAEAGVDSDNRRRAVIRTAILLMLLALGVYVIFIILAVTK